MWTVTLVLWLACCVTGLAASGYGLYELATAYRETKKKPGDEVEGDEAVVVGEEAIVEDVAEVADEANVNTIERSLVIDMSEDDDEDWEVETK